MAYAAGGTTLISGATELVGDIHFKGSLEIEGRVRGNIFAEEGSEARVRVMENGMVEGDINAPTIVINGSVRGDVHSSKHVELAAKAIVEGDVHYCMIEMVKGAQVNGSLVFSDATQRKALPKPEAPSASDDSNVSAIGNT
ncbi:polymer-forming cytoskeletal protein [Pseudomaricurvus sp. HS19]|uniref:bactofilin family protein n=1 Tax=Pseudomaricurvus sp. HS19 TaxID=2692626 RepID=UPI00136B2225|nr:polymer-forming cytoskeletal protein [Pseudomaricurvus sp. HS19]MYM63264.1 polymer-forming cytoskeletal protein [Pseudomaricurvus sp. HS19]